MPLVYACIAPHGGEVIPALAGRQLALYAPTRKGMRELASRMKAACPEVIVIASPHNLRMVKHIGVVTSAYSSGKVAEGKREVRLSATCDVAFARKLVEAAELAGLPVVAANYGALEGPMSDLAMDWGTLIPLWFFLRGARLKSSIVIVTPSRGIPIAQNVEFGKVVAKVAGRDVKRVAFVASADQAHAHRKDGPYGFSPKAKEYDQLVVEAVRGGTLDSLMTMDSEFVDAAKPDSLWQVAMLAGALSVAPMEGELLSYQVPTYYGMLCASYAPSR